MKPCSLLAALAIVTLICSAAHAQLMFQTTFDKYEHPKSHWEQWSTTKAGDYIEYTDGKKTLFRFEAVEVGDKTMKIRTTAYNDLLPKPEVRDIVHVFTQDDPKFGLPTSVADDKLKLGDKEFAAKKEEFLGFDRKPIKEVWFSDAAPFDGMLKYQQYQLGKVGEARLAARFKKGDVVFGAKP
jgi:hypothetical protein